MEIPQVQFLHKVMDVPVISKRQVPESRRGSTTGAVVQTVQDTVWKCRSCRLLHKLSTSLLWRRGRTPWSSVRETTEIPSCSWGEADPHDQAVQQIMEIPQVLFNKVVVVPVILVV